SRGCCHPDNSNAEPRPLAVRLRRSETRSGVPRRVRLVANWGPQVVRPLRRHIDIRDEFPQVRDGLKVGRPRLCSRRQDAGRVRGYASRLGPQVYAVAMRWRGVDDECGTLLRSPAPIAALCNPNTVNRRPGQSAIDGGGSLFALRQLWLRKLYAFHPYKISI